MAERDKNDRTNSRTICQQNRIAISPTIAAAPLPPLPSCRRHRPFAATSTVLPPPSPPPPLPLFLLLLLSPTATTTSASFLPFFFFNCCLSSCNCCCFHHQRPLLSILSGWLPRCLSSRQCLPSTSAPLPLITPPHLIVLLVCLLFDWLPRCLSKEEYKKQQSNGHVGKMAAGN